MLDNNGSERDKICPECLKSKAWLEVAEAAALVEVAAKALRYETSCSLQTGFLCMSKRARTWSYPEYPDYSFNPIPQDLDFSRPILICLMGTGSCPATFKPIIDAIISGAPGGILPAIYIPFVVYSCERYQIVCSDVPYTQYNEYKIIQDILSSINEEAEKQQVMAKVTFVGHSDGGIASVFYTHAMSELANLKQIKIEKIITISARLSTATELAGDGLPNRPCPWNLVPQLELIESALAESQNLINLYCIRGSRDWLVPQAALTPPGAAGYYIAEGAGHLGALLALGTVEQVFNWLYPKSTKPVKPTEPAKPTKPGKPAKPTKPAKAVKPAKSTKPAKAAKPAKSTKPAKAAKPAKSTKPAKAVKPAKLAKPTMPAKKPKI